MNKDADMVRMRKYLFEIIAQYIKLRKDKVHDYLPEIKVRLLINSV